MRSITTEGVRLTFPNLISFINGRYSYVKFERLINQQANENVKLSISAAGKRTELMRMTDAKGIAVFPLSGILTALCEDAQFLRDVMLEVSVSTWSAGLGVTYAINGFTDREIEPVNTATNPSLWPQGERMVVYSGRTSTLFIPAVSNSNITLTNESGKKIASYSGLKTPFVPFLFLSVDDTWGEESDMIHIDVTRNDKTTKLLLPVDVDRCKEGIFLRWTDKYGLDRLYRWSLKSQTCETSIEDTHLLLDENLNPYHVQNKTLTNTYELHSRMVSQPLYDLCKSIITAQKVEFFNKATSAWERCVVNEAESTDTGEILKDFVIEVSQYEYNL